MVRVDTADQLLFRSSIVVQFIQGVCGEKFFKRLLVSAARNGVVLVLRTLYDLSNLDNTRLFVGHLKNDGSCE